jgi:hypothetical protein
MIQQYKEKYVMTITKNYNGSITITDIKNNQYHKQIYFFYSMTEAKRNFKQYLKGAK